MRSAHRLVPTALLLAALSASGCSHWEPTTMADLRERVRHAPAASTRVRVSTATSGGEHRELDLLAASEVRLVGMPPGSVERVEIFRSDLETIEWWVVDETGAHWGIGLSLTALALAGGGLGAAFGIGSLLF